jgi:hypothetical protein
MALPTVKSTWVLDVETAASLDRLARDRVTMLRQLQQAVRLTQVDADTWSKTVRTERHATAARPPVRHRR